MGLPPNRETENIFHKNQFGDASLVKLNVGTFHIFQCDVMDYLMEENMVELLSPLISIVDDPRCLGYPVSLYLAHNFAKVDSEAKLLHYRDLVENALDHEGLLEPLKMEKALSNFRSEMYRFNHPWELGERKLF